MKLHEYQAKSIFRRFGIPVPRGGVASSVDAAIDVAKELKYPVVVKAQIHAGGRGKGGGVELAKTRDELERHARSILGMQLVTHQTGPSGQPVRKVLIEEASAIARELYLGIVLDRSISSLTVIASQAGGMEIEEVAAKSPEKILKIALHPLHRLGDHQAREIAFGLGLSGPQIRAFTVLAAALYRLYVEMDLSLVEVNPLVVTADGQLLALDAKMNADDNALYRHEELLPMRDLHEEDPLEVEASAAGLSYIKLDGNVGCMVNGAGLAMATMDLIKLAGGLPANFLDVGGGASKETIAKAFSIILKDPNVKAILINIFGGIVRCDRVAGGVIDAARGLALKLPVVVRLEGTNAQEASKLLATSGLSFAVGSTLKDAADKIVEALAKR
ncbi:MAG: ADP-forming succinate--CoA ligase subunit beta [Candidatus Riflebacteria bacterium]|nr:ADP-forming succinate--CoA ligase subunit beta [Candidatus Riflebacteria bacterium]